MNRMNWSTLKHLATSPKMLRWRMEHPQEDTPALKLGRAIHCAVLEPDVFASRWVAPGQCGTTVKTGGRCTNGGSLYYAGEWYCRVRGHAPEDAGDPPAGVEVLDGESLDLAVRGAQSLRAHKAPGKLLEHGRAEADIEWTDAHTGIECRGRLDWIMPDGIVDLKSTRRETLREIVGDVSRMLYHAQVAWYHDGAIAAGAGSARARPPPL